MTIAEVPKFLFAVVEYNVKLPIGVKLIATAIVKVTYRRSIAEFDFDGDMFSFHRPSFHFGFKFLIGETSENVSVH